MVKYCVFRSNIALIIRHSLSYVYLFILFSLNYEIDIDIIDKQIYACL